MTTHTVTPSNVCSCGRPFAKPFGLRVHQRTCQHWNAPHPREEGRQPAPVVVVRPSFDYRVDRLPCGCIWLAGRGVEDDMRTTSCGDEEHAGVVSDAELAALGQTRPLVLADGCQAVLRQTADTTQYCYRCGCRHGVNESGAHQHAEPLNPDVVMRRAAYALLNEIDPSAGPVRELPDRILDLVDEACAFITGWTADVRSSRAMSQLDLLGELEEVR